jgi:membrane protein required for colicin V production
MNILDIIILICLVPSIIQGLRKGFISQAISIVSLIAGIWASARFANLISEWLAQYIQASDQALRIVSFVIIMIAAFIVLGLVGKLLNGIIQLVMLGWMNRLLGAAFAFIKAVLIIGVIILVFNSINTNYNLADPKFLEESTLYPFIKNISDITFPYLKSMFTLK